MKILKEIKPQDFGVAVPAQIKFNFREAARAVVINDQDQIALLYVAKEKYHKIPGGGIDGDETIEEALQREALEEVGAEVEILGEIGEVQETKIYEDGHGIKQKSYAFLAKTVGKIKPPNFTQEEIDNGFELIWTGLDEAVEKLKSDQPELLEGKHIRLRDLVILEEAKKIISSQK